MLNEIIKNYETENAFYKQKIESITKNRLSDFHKDIETQYWNMLVRHGLQNDQILLFQEQVSKFEERETREKKKCELLVKVLEFLNLTLFNEENSTFTEIYCTDSMSVFESQLEGIFTQYEQAFNKIELYKLGSEQQDSSIKNLESILCLKFLKRERELEEQMEEMKGQLKLSNEIRDNIKNYFFEQK